MFGLAPVMQPMFHSCRGLRRNELGLEMHQVDIFIQFRNEARVNSLREVCQRGLHESSKSPEPYE